MTPQLATVAERPLALKAIRAIHTVVWALFAGCILVLPCVMMWGRVKAAVLLIGCVGLECLVLAVNRGRCPLTSVAARFTRERGPNFDIYLPEWLARWNKVIFGTLFGLDLIVFVAKWFSFAHLHN